MKECPGIEQKQIVAGENVAKKTQEEEKKVDQNYNLVQFLNF
jgi:hypothetical protein